MNNEHDFTMKSLIGPKHRHLLWKDELGDDFLLLKYAEVFRYSKNILRLYIFSPQKRSWLRHQGWILNEFDTDDFGVVDVEISKLEQIIELGAFRRRPRLNGAWLKQKERQLAHKIIPYNPNL